MNPVDRLLCRRLLVLNYSTLMTAVANGKLTRSDLWPAYYFLGIRREDVFDPESEINLAGYKKLGPGQFKRAHALVRSGIFHAEILRGVIWSESYDSLYDKLNLLLVFHGYKPIQTDGRFSADEVQRRVERLGIFSPLKVLKV